MKPKRKIKRPNAAAKRALAEQREGAARARTDLEKLSRFLASLRDLGPVKARATWAAACISAWLSGHAASLDDAFGVKKPRGNPAMIGITKWGPAAAEVKRLNLTREQAAEKYRKEDVKAVGRSLARGRAANHKAFIEAAADEIASDLRAMRERRTKALPRLERRRQSRAVRRLGGKRG